jgi:tetratricopeptide (TPR) repeat protein
MALDPRLPDAPYTLGVVLWQTGRRDEAAERFRTALALNPDLVDAHYMLGTVLRQQGRREEALAQFREAIRLMPTLAEAHLSLGQLLQQQDDREGAAAAFAEAGRLNKRKADAQASTFALGVARGKIEQGDLAGAEAQIREALALAGDNFEAHYELARLLERRGRHAEARKHFDEAYRLAPYLRPAEQQKPAATGPSRRPAPKGPADRPPR